MLAVRPSRASTVRVSCSAEPSRRAVVSLGATLAAGLLLAGNANAVPKTAEGALNKGATELASRSKNRKAAMEAKMAELRSQGKPADKNAKVSPTPAAATAGNASLD